jgi:hypothetical protein
MRDVAQSYSALGKHQDALNMNEMALEFFDRALPDYHPNICEVFMPCAVLKSAHVQFSVTFFSCLQVRLWAILL